MHVYLQITVRYNAMKRTSEEVTRTFHLSFVQQSALHFNVFRSSTPTGEMFHSLLN